jgi:hypothetical protein
VLSTNILIDFNYDFNAKLISQSLLESKSKSLNVNYSGIPLELIKLTVTEGFLRFIRGTGILLIFILG